VAVDAVLDAVQEERRLLLCSTSPSSCRGCLQGTIKVAIFVDNHPKSKVGDPGEHTKTPLRLNRIKVIWNGLQYIYIPIKVISSTIFISVEHVCWQQYRWSSTAAIHEATGMRKNSFSVRQKDNVLRAFCLFLVRKLITC
jgi:hypothetical protein